MKRHRERSAAIHGFFRGIARAKRWIATGLKVLVMTGWALKGLFKRVIEDRMTLVDISTTHAWGVVVLFCRIGTLLMMLPGFGEVYVSPRIRVLLALFLSLLFLPLLHEQVPAFPKSAIVIALIVISEVVTGVFLGLVVQWLVSAMHIVGTFVSTQAGFAAAMLFDPSQGEQSSILSALLGMITLMFIFATDLHYLFLEVLLESFTTLPLAGFVFLGDETHFLAEIAGKVFLIAVTLAAPQWIMSVVMSCAAGVLSRLMPSLQIFFLITPVQILVSIGLLAVTLAAMYEWYGEYMVQAITTLGY